MTEHDDESLAQMRGSMNVARSPDPTAYERANYVHTLQTWRFAGWPAARTRSPPTRSMAPDKQALVGTLEQIEETIFVAREPTMSVQFGLE